MKILSLLLLATLSACAQSIKADVLAFHNNPDFSGKSFSITSSAKQLDSLEYVQYANFISDELEAHGLKFITSNRKADLLVSFKYNISEGRTQTESYPVHIGVGSSFGNGFRGRGGGFYGHGGGFYGRGGGFYGTNTSSYTVFTKTLKLDIRERGKKVYEAKATNTGRSADFYKVSKCLVKALFQEFPQPSSKSLRVAIPAEACRPDPTPEVSSN